MKQNMPKVTVYEPQIGKNGYVKSNHTPFSSEIAAVENPFETNGVVNSDSARNMFLRGNPFLYNSKNSAFMVTSIEEYLIYAGKEEIAFGDVIRNPKFTPKKRKKYIKSAFKVWDKDYSKTKNSAFEESDKIVEVIGDVNLLSFSPRIKLIIFILFLVMLFIVGTSSVLWDKINTGKIGFYINNTLINMFDSIVWLKIIGNITIYVILIMIFYSTIYTYISRDFNKNYQLARNYLEKSESKISRTYRRKWKKARRYYLSLLNDKKRIYFAPLEMSEIEEGEVNITTFNNIRQATVNRAYKLKKSRPYITAFKNLLLFLSFGGSLLVIGFALYEIIIGLF